MHGVPVLRLTFSPIWLQYLGYTESVVGTPARDLCGVCGRVEFGCEVDRVVLRLEGG